MGTHNSAIYSFEIWYPDLSGPCRALVPPTSCSLRLAPQSITIEKAFRSDFGIDLAGNPVVLEAGFAPGRWTIRGNHGVGKNGLNMAYLAVDHEQGFITEGVATRLAIQRVFQHYSDVNAARLLHGLPPLKLVFKALSGGASEFKNEIWWILPMGMPTDERSAARPLDWSYSLTFWAIQKIDKMVSLTDQLNGLSLSNLAAAIKAMTAEINRISKMLNMANWPFVQEIQQTIQAVQGLASSLAGVVNTVKADFQGASDLLRSASFSVTSVLNTIHDAINLPAQVKQDLKTTLVAIRTSIGQALLSITTNGELVSATVPPAPTPIPVIPNRDLRAIAATTLGSADLWTQIADENGLTFPFVAWPGSAGTALPSGLIPGKVVSPGQTLSSTPAASQVGILDPAGLDLDPKGGDTLVGGVQNIINALTRRLNTPKGYLPHHPSYGSNLGSHLGSAMTVDSVLGIRGEAARAIQADPRVTAINSLTVNCDSTTGIVTVNASVQTILGPADFAMTAGS